MKDLIPAGARDRHIAFLGATGSGKTSGAKTGIVEPALTAHERVCIIDPTGAWWGLRLRADGKSKAFPIYIFGGDHGDYPLRARDAVMLAEAFATSSDSAVFDTSLMTVAERTTFFTDFAEAIRRKNRGPLKLVIDEAHLFMPQSGAKSGGAVPAMLHAGNNLVSLGRSRGLRITLISQRPAKLHKDSLTQVQSLVAMRLLAPQDRNAISDWISDQADPTRGKEIIASLPTLKPGEAWVWSPQDAVLEQVYFPLPRSYDSSKAPSADEGDRPQLPPLNLDALKARLSSIEAERAANDPKALKAEIARLRRELDTVAVSAPLSEDEKEHIHNTGVMAGRREALRIITEMDHEVKATVARAIGAVEKLIAPFPVAKSPQPPVSPTVSKQPVSAPAPRASLSSAASDDYSAPQRRILASLMFWVSTGEGAPTREQVAAVAGYAPGSGNFNNILGSLKSLNAVSYPTPGRVEILVEYGDATTMDEARSTLLDKVLGGPHRKILLAMKDLPSPASRDAIANGSGYAAGSGNFKNLLGKLRTLCVIDYPQQGYAEITAWANQLLTD